MKSFFNKLNFLVIDNILFHNTVTAFISWILNSILV